MLKFAGLRWPAAASWLRAGQEQLAAHSRWLSPVQFLLAWTFLNVMVNARYPLAEPAWASLVPSCDVSLILLSACGALWLTKWGARRVPALARLRVPSQALISLFWILALLCVAIRLFRLGDGIAQVFQERRANLFVDAVLAPDVVRVLYTTLPIAQFSLVVVASLVALPLVAWITYRAWRTCVRLLARPSVAATFLGALLLLGAASLWSPAAADRERYTGAFSASIVPRLREDMSVFLQAKKLNAKRAKRLSAAEARLASSKADLAKLEGENVLLFVVESYGVTVLEKPFYLPHTQAIYDAFEAMFESKGYACASNLLDSPTTGGGSWLAQATLLTGMRVSNQDDFRFVAEAEPKGLAYYFQAAGYYTISAEPGTRRVDKDVWPYKFHRRLTGPRFGYRGPRYTWAPMPDQFILDLVHRREVLEHPEPKFIKYALVSSHAPWSKLPPVVEDWSKIGNGAIYDQLGFLTFRTTWTNLSEAPLAYIRSLEYSMEVIRRYLAEFVDDDSLIIILGDHQPNGQITDHSADTSVPIHVVSRNREFIKKFAKRGYTPGMRPQLGRKVAGLETFPGDLLEDFSTPR